MGYYTRFEMGVDYDGPKAPESSLELFDQDCDNGYEFGSHELNINWLMNRDCDNMKWYDWKGDMEELSLRYPNLTLWLRGDGEEAGDNWKAWFRNGSSVVVKPKMDFPKPKDFEERLPLIDEEDVERRQIEAQIAELQAKLANL